MRPSYPIREPANQRAWKWGQFRWPPLGPAPLAQHRSARLGPNSAPPGSARLGSARLGSARLGSARLRSARLAPPGSARRRDERVEGGGEDRLRDPPVGLARLNGDGHPVPGAVRPGRRVGADLDPVKRLLVLADEGVLEQGAWAALEIDRLEPGLLEAVLV